MSIPHEGLNHNGRFILMEGTKINPSSGSASVDSECKSLRINDMK